MHVILLEKIHKNPVTVVASGEGDSVAVRKEHEGDLLPLTHF